MPRQFGIRDDTVAVLSRVVLDTNVVVSALRSKRGALCQLCSQQAESAGGAKQALHEIWMAEAREIAEKAFDAILSIYGAKYPKATACFEEDQHRDRISA